MSITLGSRVGQLPVEGRGVFTGESRREAFSAQLRASDTADGSTPWVTLDGYASTIGVPYVMYDMFGEYQEVIAPTAFDVTLAAGPDVNFLVNHSGLAMARTTAGTLDLSVDSTGLRSVAKLNPKRSDVQDLRHAIDDGAVDQMSFAFKIVDGRWSKDFLTYTITEVDLNRGDVSAVNYGANPDTSISARMKQALDGIEHLAGEPLMIAKRRLDAKLAESGEVVVPLSRGGVVPMVGRTVATLRALEALDED
jgi:HK97 family phage prohead protease